MKRLFPAFLLVLSGFASAGEIALPVNSATWTSNIVGLDVGLYFEKGISATDKSAQNQSVSAYVQQAGDFSQLMSQNFPSTANPTTATTSSTVYSYQAAGDNSGGGGVGATTITYGSFGLVFVNVVDAANYVANLRSCAYSSSPYCEDPVSHQPWSVAGDNGVVNYYNYAYTNPADAYAEVNSWIAAGRPMGSPHQGYSVSSISNQILGTAPNEYTTLTMAVAQGSQNNAGGFDSGWQIPVYEPGQAPSTPQVGLPQLFQDSLNGWSAQMPTRDYLTDSPALSLDTLRIHVVDGLAAYAVTNGQCDGLNLLAGNTDSSAIENCVTGSFNILPSNQWLITPQNICITESTGNNPQCVDVYTYTEHLSGACPNGYAPNADGSQCSLSNADMVHTNAGWGCRIYRTSAGLYQANPNDDDCMAIKNNLAQVGGGINMLSGNAVITWLQISNGTQTQLTFQQQVQENQNFQWTAVVDNSTNKVLSITSGNYAGPPPELQGTPGQGVGLDGGATGGMDPNGNGGLSPGYGGNGGTSFNPSSPGSGGSGSSAGNGSASAPGGASAPNGASSPVTSGAGPNGLPQGTPSYLSNLLSSTVATSAVCPVDFFQMNLGTILGRSFIISDSGVFCNVMSYFQEFMRLVNIAWGYVYGIVIILSA